MELNGVARRCQSLRLGPRDAVMLNNNLNMNPTNCNNNKLTYNMATDNGNKVMENGGDQETKLLMDNQVYILKCAGPSIQEPPKDHLFLE